jgi:hypothetical protein
VLLLCSELFGSLINLVGQALSRIAKDLNKISAKSAIQTVVLETPEDHNQAEPQLFRSGQHLLVHAAAPASACELKAQPCPRRYLHASCRQLWGLPLRRGRLTAVLTLLAPEPGRFSPAELLAVFA